MIEKLIIAGLILSAAVPVWYAPGIYHAEKYSVMLESELDRSYEAGKASVCDDIKSNGYDLPNVDCRP